MGMKIEMGKGKGEVRHCVEFGVRHIIDSTAIYSGARKCLSRQMNITSLNTIAPDYGSRSLLKLVRFGYIFSGAS